MIFFVHLVVKEKQPHFHEWLSFSCINQLNECLCKLVIQPKGPFLDVVITEHCCGREGGQSCTVSWEAEGASKKAVWKSVCVCVLGRKRRKQKLDESVCTTELGILASPHASTRCLVLFFCGVLRFICSLSVYLCASSFSRSPSVLPLLSSSLNFSWFAFPLLASPGVPTLSFSPNLAMIFHDPIKQRLTATVQQLFTNPHLTAKH